MAMNKREKLLAAGVGIVATLFWAVPSIPASKTALIKNRSRLRR